MREQDKANHVSWLATSVGKTHLGHLAYGMEFSTLVRQKKLCFQGVAILQIRFWPSLFGQDS